MHAPTYTNRHAARVPFPHLIYSHFESPLSQSEGQRGMITREARRHIREGTDRWEKERREWQLVPRIVLSPPLPSDVLISLEEVQTTAHTCLLLSILLEARWERKWLPAPLSLQDLFSHINTFTAWLHLLQMFKTTLGGSPELWMMAVCRVVLIYNPLWLKQSTVCFMSVATKVSIERRCSTVWVSCSTQKYIQLGLTCQWRWVKWVHK